MKLSNATYMNMAQNVENTRNKNHDTCQKLSGHNDSFVLASISDFVQHTSGAAMNNL